MSRQLAEVDRDVVESLLAMSRVHLEASRQGAEYAAGAGTLPTLPDQPDAVGSALALVYARSARDLLAQQNVLGTTRFAMPKRSLLRVSKLFTHRIVAAVQGLTDAVEVLIGLHDHARVVHDQEQAVHQLAHATAAEELVRVHDQTLGDFVRRGNSLRAQIVGVEIASQNALDSLAGFLDGRMAELELERKEDRLEREQDRLEIQRLRALISRRTVDRSPAAVPGTSGTGPAAGDELDDSTYVEFERRFRGSPEEIKARQLDALQFVEAIAGNSAPLLDIGCGRGEWLEVLRDAGISAYGVDFNAGMVAEAQELELDARCEDAVTHLENLEESSLAAVSAFHFAEHVPLQVLGRVLDGAFLALRPGGLLLIETPNPTNLVVGSASFYLDPTHLRPLHPDFLAFFVESRGFEDVEVNYVHPVIDDETLSSGAPEDGYDPRLGRVVESAEWALFGPQDYVLVGRRAGGVG